MGRAHVEGFLATKAKVVALDKSWAGDGDFRSELAENDNALALEMDVTSDTQIDAAYKAVLDEFGTTDCLINNAGLIFFADRPGRATTLETTDQDWLNSFGVNVFGTLKVTRRFIQPMIEKRRGSIINIVSSGILNASSGGGFTALRPWSREMPYMSSKAALATMSFYLADEVKEHNVAVNLLVPGHTRGSWFDDQMRERLAAGHDAGPRPVRVEHIVPIAKFLAGQDASGATGKMFDVLHWNEEHGLGGYDTWKDTTFPPDIEAAFAAQGERQPTLSWGAQRR
jgi:1,1a-dihydroxy-1-hydro-9-fluorenone dehydrogenase